MQIHIAVNYGDAIAILRWVSLWRINTNNDCMCVAGVWTSGFHRVSPSNGIQNGAVQITIVLQRAVFISLLFSSVYIPIACVCVSMNVCAGFCYFGFWVCFWVLCKLLTWIFNVPWSTRGLTCIWLHFVLFRMKYGISFLNFSIQ